MPPHSRSSKHHCTSNTMTPYQNLSGKINENNPGMVLIGDVAIILEGCHAGKIGPVVNIRRTGTFALNPLFLIKPPNHSNLAVQYSKCRVRMVSEKSRAKNRRITQTKTPFNF